MVASVNQDFVTYVGDSVQPIFTVFNAAGTATIDISTVSQIAWNCRRNLDEPVLVTKTKTSGAITFVTNGSDGKFQVLITPADTSGLSGFYVHEAVITDSGGNVTTVSVGRMQVGLAPAWTYDPTQLATKPLYQVRMMIGDNLQGDQLMMDGEINYLITQYSNAKLAAAAACRAIALKFARQVDIVQGTLKTNYSEKSKQYQLLSLKLERDGYGAGAIVGYAGGISRQDVQTQDQNTDRVQPEFAIGMSDNFIPVGPVGNEQPLGNIAGSQDVFGGPT